MRNRPQFSIQDQHESVETQSDKNIDPLSMHIKSLKELARTLRRVLKLLAMSSGCNIATSRELQLTLLKLAECGTSSESCDDQSICHVDYLATNSLVKRLEQQASELEQSDSRVAQAAELESNMSDDLERMVVVKIRQLKQIYRHLKCIRDHYLAKHKNTPSHQKHCAGLAAETPIPIIDKQPRCHLKSLDCLTSDGTKKPATKSISKFTSSPNVVTTARSLEMQNSTTLGHCVDVEQQTVECQFGLLCPIEFVYNIEKLLALKRASGNRMVKLNEMNSGQLESEKLELQKNLLRYEHWFGRPISQGASSNFVSHLYERYRIVKIMRQRRQELKLDKQHDRKEAGS